MKKKSLPKLKKYPMGGEPINSYYIKGKTKYAKDVSSPGWYSAVNPAQHPAAPIQTQTIPTGQTPTGYTTNAGGVTNYFIPKGDSWVTSTPEEYQRLKYNPTNTNQFAAPTITNIKTFEAGGMYNPADPNRSLIPEQNSGIYSNGYTGETYGMPTNPEQPIDNRSMDQKVQGSMGWMAYAQAAKGLVKSGVKRDANGMPISNTGKAVDQFSEESHKTAMNEIQEGDYEGAAREITGFGKIGRGITNALGKGQVKDGFWGKVNKATDNQYYSQDQYAVPQYPHGGEFNAEVEKEEMMRMPNGQTEQVNGPSHEMGGVPVNIPAGTEIFSDRLKHPETKKTFAKEAAKYKIKDNAKTATEKLINSIRQKKLDQIFQTQEQFKQEKVARYAKKMGLTIPNSEMRMGGKMCYPDGGIKQDTQFNPDGTYKSGITDQQYADMVDADIANNFQTPNNNTGTLSNYSDELGLGANILGQNIGNIYDLAQTKFGKKYDKENSGQITPNLLSSSEAIRDANIEASATRRSLKDLTQGNVGAYLTNLTSAQTANTLNKAKIREQYDNLNTDILNKATYHNQATRMADKANEQANKAKAEDISRDAVRGIAVNTTSAIRDYKLGKRDKESLDIIARAYPNYEYDSKSRTWKHKTTGKKLEV